MRGCYSSGHSDWFRAGHLTQAGPIRGLLPTLDAETQEKLSYFGTESCCFHGELRWSSGGEKLRACEVKISWWRLGVPESARVEGRSTLDFHPPPPAPVSRFEFDSFMVLGKSPETRGERLRLRPLVFKPGFLIANPWCLTTDPDLIGLWYGLDLWQKAKNN